MFNTDATDKTCSHCGRCSTSTSGKTVWWGFPKACVIQGLWIMDRHPPLPPPHLQPSFLKWFKSVFSLFLYGQWGGRGRGGGNTLLRVRWGRLRRYLPIPELPLERRSGSVSRSAPCTGTTQPADRKARLASHKEANMEEHFLSQKGVRPENTLQPSFLTGGRWQTHTGWPTSGNAWWIGILFFRHTCTEESQHATRRTKEKINSKVLIRSVRVRECEIKKKIFLFHYQHGSVNWI